MANEQEAALAALAQLQERVYVPVYMRKCAELGIPITSEKDLQNALLIAAMLKQAEVENTSNFLEKGAAALKQAAGMPVAKPADRPSDPVVRTAIEALKGAK